jgi:hypothetical protein
MASLKMRVQEITLDNKDMQQNFSTIKKVLEMSASADKLDELVNRMSDFAPMH